MKTLEELTAALRKNIEQRDTDFTDGTNELLLSLCEDVIALKAEVRQLKERSLPSFVGHTGGVR